MTLYDSAAVCRNQRCTVIEYCYDSSEHETPPPCPACAPKPGHPDAPHGPGDGESGAVEGRFGDE